MAAHSTAHDASSKIVTASCSAQSNRHPVESMLIFEQHVRSPRLLSTQQLQHFAQAFQLLAEGRLAESHVGRIAADVERQGAIAFDVQTRT